MMFIYKISEVKIRVSLRKHLDVTFVDDDLAAYTQCLGPHRKLIMTAILLNFTQTNLKIMHIQKIEK